MAQPATEQSTQELNLPKAWKILFPECVNQEVQQDAFGLGPTQSCTPDRFHNILSLWWNQELKLADASQLQPDHLPLLSKYLNSDDTSSDQKMDVSPDSITNSDPSSNVKSIWNYLGFYQPKNGTCGFVAALHAILLYKMWDQVIHQSMEQSADSNKSTNLRPTTHSKYDYKHLMATSIAHALIISANAASSKIEYDPTEFAQNQNGNKSTKPTFWICVLCNAKNDAANVFCEVCYQEPPPPTTEVTDSSQPMDVDQEDVIKTTKVIESCTHITIVTEGQLPSKSDENQSLFYDESLFKFKVNRIAYDPQQDIESATLQIAEYLLKSTDFETAFLAKGSCVRILLSLIMTHGVDRCEYELVIDEYPEIFRQFRDESLVLGPYGFCSQNLVNLTMFGHCKPMIDAPPSMSYHYGFLGHDVINPGATGFFQTGYGYEYPMYPIWVVLSGTHYTTLFSIPTHLQKYNGEHVLDCYHAMVRWMTEKDKRKDVDGKIIEKKQGDNNGASVSVVDGVAVKTFDDVVTDKLENEPKKNWKCDLCGTTNDETYIFCSQCAREKEKAVAIESIISGVDGGGGGGGGAVESESESGWKCTFCGQQNQSDHVLCANISCLREKTSAVTAAQSEQTGAEETESKVDDQKVKEEEELEDAVHFEVDLLCFNGLPPSGPLLSPITMKVITEQQSEEEKNDRNRVIGAEEVISVVDRDEADEAKKVKYLKGHALVQRIESKQRKNVYFYEIAISLESHFEEIQKLSLCYFCFFIGCCCMRIMYNMKMKCNLSWKSPYFMKFKDEEDWKGVKSFFDPKIMPNSELKTYEYPSVKWRCCACYLGDDMNKKYAGYNELENALCKACGKPMYEGLRTLIVKYDHVPFYIRESKIDKIYQNALVKLLNKRFRNLVNAEVDNECLPVI